MKENHKTSDKHTFTVIPGETDFASLYPELLLEWDYDKNTHLDPHKIHPGKKKKAWWIGSCGHNWESTVASRTLKGSGCNFCSGRYVLPGYNDILSQRPDMAKLWCYETNNGLKPEEVNPHSAKWVNWKCELGHTWKRQPCEQSRSKESCPFCSNARCLANFNCLKTRRPDVANEWHPTKNGDLLPEQFMPSSKKKVWWLGTCGHQWEGKITHRTSKNTTGTGCPVCCGKKVIKDINSAGKLMPELFDIWDKDKNGVNTLYDFTLNSAKTVYWKCNLGHTWKARMTDQIKIKNNCVFCNNTRIWTGFNDLATLHPQLKNEWDFAKNNKYDVNKIHPGSYTKVWWKCKLNHKWEASPGNRTIDNNNCPWCSRMKVLPGFNDFATTHPKLIKEWDYNKNKEIDPSQIFSGDNQLVWWKCKLGHGWQTSPNNRVCKNSTCPTCSNRTVHKGFNDLSTTHPNLAAEWHPTANGKLKPDEVISYHGHRVWWQCAKGHEWQTTISARKFGHTCRRCVDRFSKIEKELYDELKVIYPDTFHGETLNVSWGKTSVCEVDIFVPSKNTVIEYDGWYWHQHKFDKDLQKSEALVNAGYKVIRIRAKPLGFLKFKDNNFVQIAQDSQNLIGLTNKIINLLK